MNEKIVKMVVHSFSDLVGKYNKGVITLKEKDGEHYVPIVCNANEKDRVIAFLNGKTLPFEDRFGAFGTLLKMMTPTLRRNYNLVVVKLIIGRYLACLCRKGSEIPEALSDDMIRIEDAIILSYLAKMPLYMTESLMESQSIKVTPRMPIIALPYTVLSNEMLHDAYKESIDDERYEVAQVLKLELDRRRNITNQQKINDKEK